MDESLVAHALQQNEYQLESISLPGFDGYCTISSIRQEDQCCLYIYPIPTSNVEQPNTSIELPEFFSNMVFESMPDYMLVKDKEFRIVLSNSNFLKVYPEEMRDSIIGTTTLENYDPVEREAFLTMDRKALAEGFSSTEETINFPDGKVRTLFTRKIRFIGPNNQPYILVLATDITDENNAKRLIQEQNDKLKEQAQEALKLSAQAKAADQAKSLFLANMSHEIRTPLHGILGFLNNLADLELSDDQRQYAKGAQLCADQLSHQVDDILDLVKVEAGELDINLKVTLSPGTMIQQICQALKPIADDKSIYLQADCMPDLPKWAHSDSHRIRQILINLVNNAIKFTTTGGVTISASYNHYAHLLTYEVRDTGKGIPKDSHEEIFEAFSQIQPGGQLKSGGGAGLGLAICKRLIDLLGGTIEVDSVPGEGSTFRVSLPCPIANDPKESSFSQDLLPLDIFNKRYAGTKVLIVEDNKVNQTIVNKMCEKFGLASHAVEHGAECLQHLNEQPDHYDLILMDCQMPVMDGYTATGRIRELERAEGKSGLPIIALTAHAMKGDRERCLNAGMSDYATKPFNQAILQKIIQTWVLRKH